MWTETIPSPSHSFVIQLLVMQMVSPTFLWILYIGTVCLHEGVWIHNAVISITLYSRKRCWLLLSFRPIMVMENLVSNHAPRFKNGLRVHSSPGDNYMEKQLFFWAVCWSFYHGIESILRKINMISTIVLLDFPDFKISDTRTNYYQLECCLFPILHSVLFSFEWQDSSVIHAFSL